MAVWSRLTAGIAALGIGRAGAAAIEPVMEPLKQDAWKQSQTRVLGLGELAAMCAQGLATIEQATDSAARHGFSPNRLRALAQLALTVPGVGELLRTLDRGTITPEQFDHALAKHQIEPQYWDALRDLANNKLDPAQVAAAIHRGLIPDPGLLKGEQPSGARKVESYPVYPIDPLEEAKADGYNRDRLGVLVGLQGLPMGPHEAAQAFFRGIITRGDYIAAFNESNNRNEWAEALLEQSRQIPTARDFFENALRGYHDFAWAVNEAKRHGMSEADATVIYQNQGRPMNVRQITQALARGGTFKPEPGEIKDPYDAAIVEGNLKPAYYDLAKALRYTLPSVFAIRQLATSGVWGYEKTRDRLLDWGWLPADAEDVAKAWAGGSGSAGSQQTKAEVMDEYAGGYISPDELRAILTDLGYTGAALEREIHLGDARRLKSMRERVVKAIADAYRAHAIDATAASSELAEVNVLGDAASMLIALWDKERRFTVRELSDAQVAKAASHKIIDPAAALAELQSRGFSAEDAQHLIDLAP